MFGQPNEVDSVSFLIGSAASWGGNPPCAPNCLSVFPEQNDGQTPHRLTVKDVPVDGFWFISVYTAKGFFEKNEFGLYSLNDITTKQNDDGSTTIQFGGDPKDAPNFLAVSPGWNYTVCSISPAKPSLMVRGSFQKPARSDLAT